MINFTLVFLRILNPELSHIIALKFLKFLNFSGLLDLFFNYKFDNDNFAFKNLIFRNRLGLAAGLDKNGDYFNELGKLGFGFIEVGTITPLPQIGNTKPRIWRLTDQNSIINRLGFNNKGVDYLVTNLKKRTFKGILGVNIGANSFSTGKKRIDDYLICFKKVYKYADYITVNISSPNTPHLRELHQPKNFHALMESLSKLREELGFINPVLIKVSPDEDYDTLAKIVGYLKRYNFDGLVATNTSISRPKLKDENILAKEGGLSGKLLFDRSTEVLHTLSKMNPGLLIGVGGVFDSSDFKKKMNVGADLVQIYSSFVFEGPSVIKKILANKI